MKRRRLPFVTLLLSISFTAVFSYAWHQGFVPVKASMGCAGVRAALNLKWLPWSVGINSTHSVILPDYIFEADFQIDPKDFDKLLTGRSFVRRTFPPEITRAYFIQNYQGFECSESWTWDVSLASKNDRNFDSRSVLFTNGAHNRVLVLVVEGN